jgi:hypothetical protein
VFLVGTLGQPDPVQPEPLPPAPQTPFGWKIWAYEDNWRRQLAYLIEQRGLYGGDISLNETQFSDPQERLGVFVVFGWRATPRSTAGGME